VALLSVTEYQRIRVGEFDPSHDVLSVTSTQAEILTNLKQTYGFEIFKYVNGKAISAQQYVGVHQLGSHTIEVLPKIDAATSNIRRNLVAMLAETLELDISAGEIARVGQQSYGILEILVKLFCDKLFAQVHRGLVRRYEVREGNLSVLRGKLGVVEQVRMNGANPERLFCRYDEFLEDNPLNQVLKAAIRLLLKTSRELSNQRKLAELLLVFDEITDFSAHALPWTKIAFDRMSDRYKPCFKLAELFLKRCPPDVTGGVVQGISLFFDMNVLFEEYIGRVAERAMRPDGFQVSLQGRNGNQRHVAVDSLNKSAFGMRPDVIGRKSGEIAWILDTKWKTLSREEWRDGVSQADLYQMYAYASCYHCARVVLLYPHHFELGDTPGVRGTYRLNPWATIEENVPRLVLVASVDLRDLSTVLKQLKQILVSESEMGPNCLAA
jgi:5-methylcytosine-specific restriction enzyme subunit McrC